MTAEIVRLGGLRKGRPFPGKVTDTQMMREAAEHLARDGGVNDEWLRLALAYEWRMSSAAAHGRSWPVHVRKTERIPLLDGGGEVRRLTSSVQEVTQSVAAATLMASEAWRLWDLRRISHAT